MKTYYKVLTAIGMLALSASSLLAQNTASTAGSATGNLIRPISITKTHDLNYGTFTSPTIGGGTITLCATNVGPLSTQNAPAVTPTTTGQVSTLNTAQSSGNGGEPMQLGTFEVMGESNYTFCVTLPSQIEVVPIITWNGFGGNAPSMTLTNWTTNLTNNAGTLISTPFGGYLYLAVGATLNVNQNQVTGGYTGSFSVSAAYN
jgi:hypothetical protein